MSETARDWREIHQKLSERGSFVVKSYSQPNKRGGSMTFSYIDARDVMDRLDEVVGPENWEDDYELLDPAHGIVKCRLTVYGTTKSGIGYPNNPGSDVETEPVKAAESDALKRAAVKWGVGRFLYSLGKPGTQGNDKDRPQSQARTAEPKPQPNGTASKPQVSQAKDPIPPSIYDGFRSELLKLAEDRKTSTGAELERGCKELGIDTHGKGVNGLAPSDYEKLTTWALEQRTGMPF